jgi:hypothetical protein
VATGGPHRRQLLRGLLATVLATAPGWHKDAVAGMLPLERGRFIEISDLRNKAHAGSTAETLPDATNRIVPDEIRTDAIGVPRPRIHYRIDDYAKAGLSLATRRHEAIFAAFTRLRSKRSLW